MLKRVLISSLLVLLLASNATSSFITNITTFPCGQHYDNEWGYMNYSNQNPPASGNYDFDNATAVHNTYRGLSVLIEAAVKSARANDTSYKRWFGTVSNRTIIRVYKRMFQEEFLSPDSNYAVWKGTDALSSTTYVVNDLNTPTSTKCANTKSPIGGYTVDKFNGTFHFCPLAFQKKKLSEISCRPNMALQLGDLAFEAMVLHELTHMELVGGYVLNKSIVDENNGSAYAPWTCANLPDNIKLTNAQNYAWHALDAYLSQYCGKPLGDPVGYCVDGYCS